jgi:ribonuclease E
MKKEMLINVLQPEECRIAILEDGVLEELYVERTSHESYVGNIYKGRIVNIEPSIQAAFVDFGVGRNGFLHVSDVEPAYYRHLEPRRADDGGRRMTGRDRHRGGPRPGGEQERRAPSDRPSEEAGTAGEAPPESEGRPERGSRGRRSSRGGRSRRSRRDEPGRRGAEAAARPVAEPGEEGRPAPDQEQYGLECFPEQPEESRETRPEDRPEQEPPQVMGSAERRTEEDSPGVEPVETAPALTDADLFFPRQESAEEEPGLRETFARREEEFQAVGGEKSAPAGTAAPEEGFGEDERPEAIAEERELDFDQAEYEPRPRPRRPREGGRRGRGRDEGRGGPRRSSRSAFGRPKPLIQDIFKRGQEVLVQVIKEGIGTKGPTLSTYISIAGRYLVLMPGLNRIGVSRKIDDDEQRRRLREILNELQPPKGLGFIIRTAGLDKNKKELQRDLAYLSRLWQVVVRRIRKLKAPAEIYQESDMITRTIRDTFTNEIDTIWVDEPAAFEHAQEFLQIVMPRYASRIKRYDGSEPLFFKYGIEKEIARIQQRHVPLPNGGSIVIDQTEALVAIDVNSGNFRADNNAEETAYQMNQLAAKEIARQLRLRDLGGVIVNDFIDMRDEKHRRGVERALRDAIKRDRARTKILKISAFGIIEMTRQRIRPSLKRSVYQDCPHCEGTGQVKTCESMSIDVMRMLQLAAHNDIVNRIHVRVAEDVANYLLNKKRKEITRLEEGGDLQITVQGGVALAPETLEFVCYDRNNNEVKFLPYEDSPPRRR